MKEKLARLRTVVMLFIVILSLIIGSKAWAQTATIEDEKAKLVSKFAKYVEWPTEARLSAFIIGVYDDQEKFEFFQQYFANKGVKNKDIVVTLVTSITDAKSVNILYIYHQIKKTR